MLLCPVRECGLKLVREGSRVVCANGHSFDVARSGYINLLQPQDRRSKEPGDTVAAVEARRRLHDRGVTAPLLRAIAELAQLSGGDELLDAGCGEGFYAGNLARESGARAHGLDISIPAIKAAARRYPESEWIVANADRFVPYEDGAFSMVVSITGRMNEDEFRRVLRADGLLLVAVAAPDDFVELRGAGRDRVDRTVETFGRRFELRERRRVTTVAELDAAGVQDVRHAIYRPVQRGAAEGMRVTLSLDLLLFGVRR